MALEFENETRIMRGCFFDVQNEVGRGRSEEAYHQACKLWFEERGLPVASKPPHPLLIRGQEAHRLFPDFVGWNAISVELKSVTRHLYPSEFVQLFDYLKLRRDRVGLLVNMGLDRVEIERVVYHPPETEWVENWDSWSEQIHGADRDIGRAIRGALQTIYAEHSTGYGEEVVSKLVVFSLQQLGMAVSQNPIAKAVFRNVVVDEAPLACMVVNQRIVLILSALFDTNDFNVNRGRSYLKALDLEYGVAVDFGKRRAEIIGIRRSK